MMRLSFVLAGVLLCAAPAAAPAQMPAAPASGTAASLPTGVLHREQAGALMPPAVFYSGQSATVQARNSGGIKFPGGKLMLTAMVDTSGYSTAVQQTYQAYLLVETPILVGGKKLAAGAYGYGFIDGHKVVVMDIGGTRVLESATTHDDSLKRPTPLQVLEGPGGHGFRLYLGREYVEIVPAP